LQDIGGEADSLTGLARTSRRQGRLAEAATCFEQVLELCRELADPDREAKATLFSPRSADCKDSLGRPSPS
jgi:hypothetical protein